MENSLQLLNRFKASGHRLTKVRRALVDILCSCPGPLSAAELITRLKKRSLEVNKTTVYRELEFLLAQKVIREIDLLEGMKRYERVELEGHHHHHLVCQRCGKIECVEMDRDLDELEKQIVQKYKFKVTSHTLEFFGLCAKCFS